MSMLVSMGAMIQCPFGSAPLTLEVIPEGSLVTTGTPVATIADCVPLVNIPTFGKCSSPSNPIFVSTGVNPPCVPETTPWVPGAPTVLIDGVPALTNESVCTCANGGVITIEDPGQFIVTVAE